MERSERIDLYSILCDSGALKSIADPQRRGILEILEKKNTANFLIHFGCIRDLGSMMLQIMNLRFEGYQHGSANFHMNLEFSSVIHLQMKGCRLLEKIPVSGILESV